MSDTIKIVHHTCNKCGKPLKAYSFVKGEGQLLTFCNVHFRKLSQQYGKESGMRFKVISQGWEKGKRAKRTKDERVKKSRRRR